MPNREVCGILSVVDTELEVTFVWYRMARLNYWRQSYVGRDLEDGKAIMNGLVMMVIILL